MFARTYARIVLGAAAAALVVGTAGAASVPNLDSRTEKGVIPVAKKQASRKDCTPYNGPFGFYGNIWCQPPNEMSYLRNLGSPWPQQTPPALKKVKPDNSTDW